MIFRSLITPRDKWLFRVNSGWDAARVRRTLDASVPNKSRYALISTNAKNSPADAVKLIRPRSLPRDTLRKYMACQAQREYRAARQLADWDIPSVTVHGWGFAFAPRAPYESMLLMEYRPGCTNARAYLEDNPDDDTRWRLLDAIASDVAQIYRRGYHHNDCHLGNVLVDRKGNRTWVDNELRRVYNRKSLWRRFEQTLDLLDRSCKQSISAEMKNAFTTRCRSLLGTIRPT